MDHSTGPDLTPVAGLAAIAGARPEHILEIDRLMRIVHHVDDAEVKRPSCGAAPMGWWRAHRDWDKVDCENCLKLRPDDFDIAFTCTRCGEDVNADGRDRTGSRRCDDTATPSHHLHPVYDRPKEAL